MVAEGNELFDEFEPQAGVIRMGFQQQFGVADRDGIRLPLARHEDLVAMVGDDQQGND